MKYKIDFRMIAIMLIVGVLSSGATLFIHKKIVGSEALENLNMQSILINIARNINMQAPALLDEFTRLDSATAVMDYALVYNYTLLGESSLEKKKETVRLIKPVLKQKVLTSEDMKVFRENKVGIIYVYNDNDGTEVGRVIINKKEYK